MCDELIATQKCTFYMMCSIQIQDGDVDFYSQIKVRAVRNCAILNAETIKKS